MKSIRKIALAAMLIAIGIVLPLAFHAIPNAGRILLPMHIPILLCGIVLGFPYGLIVGILTPLLSSFITGMPPLGILPPMLFELGTYGAISSVIMQYIKIDNLYIRIYTSLISAMILGRIIFGVLNSLIFSVGDYSMQMWVTAAFITALPGIIIQIVLIPGIVIILVKAKLIDFDNII
jgi:niacin transporter